MVEERDIAGKFLPECERGGVLQMGATDFDDVGEGLGFGIERVAERFDGGDEAFQHDRGGGDGHRGWEGVVRRLRHVHMVIGVHRCFGSHLAAGEFDRAVRDDLVGVHVALGSGAGLPDAEGEVGIKFSRDHLIGGADDEVALVGGEFAEVGVGEGTGFFQDAEGFDHLGRQDVFTDVEMDE